MKINRNTFIIGLISFNIILDQVSKFLVRGSVVPGSETPVLGDYFTLHNVENSGAFLGMGSDFNPTLKIILLLILPIIVLGLVLRYVFKEKSMDKVSLIGFSCIIGGGLANIYDRLMYGEVTDFFHIDLGGVFKTGIFNIADMSVMLGMGFLIFSSFKNKK